MATEIRPHTPKMRTAPLTSAPCAAWNVVCHMITNHVLNVAAWRSIVMAVVKCEGSFDHDRLEACGIETKRGVR